jgi:competence protein ComEA
LYRLRDGSRVADALARAGGVTAKAELELVNRAALVADGEQIVVPRRGAAVAAAGGGGAGAGTGVSTGPVHLNSATIEQLDALSGVGPVTAQKIVDYREQHGGFRSVDELDAVPGIGPARLEQLRGAVAP